MHEYRPSTMTGFEQFDKMVESCYVDEKNIMHIIPSTLEGCVVRVSDIIAYLGKDRQDAERAHIISNRDFESSPIGTYNAEIINNLIVNIVENSYGKPYIKLDENHFDALKKAKTDNYTLIYKDDKVNKDIYSAVEPMMAEVYDTLLSDVKLGKKTSPIFTHHVDYVNTAHYKRDIPYEETEPNQLVVDYIASMTDDYFVELYGYLFPDRTCKIQYKGYFE